LPGGPTLAPVAAEAVVAAWVVPEEAWALARVLAAGVLDELPLEPRAPAAAAPAPHDRGYRAGHQHDRAGGHAAASANRPPALLTPRLARPHVHQSPLRLDGSV